MPTSPGHYDATRCAPTANSATDPGGVSWAREAVLVTGAVGAVWVCGVVWVIEHRHETVTGYGTRLRGVEEGKGAS